MKHILSEIEFVMDHAYHVHIHEEKLHTFAQTYIPKTLVGWEDILPFARKDFSFREKIAFYFVINSINFSYW